MNSILYRLMYRLGMSRWDTGQTPPEVVEAFQTGSIPAGAALDLGCGTGTNVIYMAKQGRQAVGIDFVPAAIAKARAKAEQAGVADRARFLQADVTRLAELDLPRCGFALDMGCVHGIKGEGQQQYARGLASVMVPGGKYLLYTLNLRKRGAITFGMDPEQVPPVFAPWFELERMERGAFWDQGSAWFWWKRKEQA